ncbi:MAG: STAS domain-containing protein [Lewinellaceae bacterium]|nr:STAS domain-containing protein [Lewinellaceae bacterium]
MNQLTITFQEQTPQTKATYTLEGILCGMEAITCKNRLIQAIRSTPQDLLLDLRAVIRIDLGGINALAVICQQVQQSGNRLVITEPRNECHKELVALTKMDRFLPLQRLAVA